MTDIRNLQLEKNSAVPLYEQLRQGLLEAINSGELPAGTKMPTEEELCQAFGISRPVARQAYNALIEAGYVERMRGRGTFVKRPDAWNHYYARQTGFAKEMARLGVTPRTVLLAREWCTYTPELFRKLQLGRDVRCLHLVRMRYGNEQPYALVENYVPETIFPGIDRFDFEKNSLYDTFEKEYGVRCARSHRTLAARIATAEQAALFGTRRGSPIMYEENLVFDQYDRPIDLSKDFMDGYTKQYEFEVSNT